LRPAPPPLPPIGIPEMSTMLRNPAAWSPPPPPPSPLPCPPPTPRWILLVCVRYLRIFKYSYPPGIPEY
jgi:hypothetical protein